MKTLKYTLIALILSITTVTRAQDASMLFKGAEAHGDYHFDHYTYNKACSYYLKAIEKNYNDDKVKLKLAETYVKLNDPKDAAIWYAKVIKRNRIKVKPIHYLHFAEALKALGKDVLSEKMYNRYQRYYKNDQRVALRMTDVEAKGLHVNKAADVKVSVASFSSTESDFSPTFFNGDLVFVSSRDNDRAVQRTCEWTNGNYYDLFRLDTASGKVTSFLPRTESMYHEGPTAFGDSMMYFTKNDYQSKEVYRDKEGVSRLKIFEAKLNGNGKWEDYKELPINQKGCSTGHPTISSDGRVMYFSSDRPGGFGGTDIYKSELIGGKWSKPVNMGRPINTEGNEMFPKLYQDRVLFFSSNGHHGMGGLDIYYADLFVSNGHLIRNLGRPINSRYDDFGIALEQGAKSGFFSSNREGQGRHHDDIFSFSSKTPIIRQFLVEGVVMSALDDSFVKGTEIELLNNEMQLVDKVVMTEDFNFNLSVADTGKYFLRVTKEGFFSNTDLLIIKDSDRSQPVHRNVFLTPMCNALNASVLDKDSGFPIAEVKVSIQDNATGEILYDDVSTKDGAFSYVIGTKAMQNVDYVINLKKKGYWTKTINLNKELKEFSIIHLGSVNMDKIQVGDNLAEILKIKPIYFEVGESVLTSRAKDELDKIISTMKENPSINVSLKSFTDARGNADSNLELSVSRADACVKYVLSNGISNDRIAGNGYGEKGIVNGCVDGVNCTENEHRMNRRTEFRITSL